MGNSAPVACIFSTAVACLYTGTRVPIMHVASCVCTKFSTSLDREVDLQLCTEFSTHVGRSKNSGNPWETPTGVGINDQICVTKVMEARHVSRDNQCRHLPGFGKQYRIIPKIKTMFKTAVEIACSILQKPMLPGILPPSDDARKWSHSSS